MIKKYFLKLVLIIFVISTLGVFASLYVPIHWENNPPKCCDIPNGGTYYGFPFHIKGESCCGIAGPSHPFTFLSYSALIYDFIIYFTVLTLLSIFIYLIVKKRNSKTNVGFSSAEK